ncbi:hypothetical protein B0A53_06283 [Rhodotorula sp. CCFEE 5036]|nr:hypothetical protein B0A53_06283 [Rhodotorula sp. CCFEE 5036]
MTLPQPTTILCGVNCACAPASAPQPAVPTATKSCSARDSCSYAQSGPMRLPSRNLQGSRVGTSILCPEGILQLRAGPVQECWILGLSRHEISSVLNCTFLPPLDVAFLSAGVT